MLGVIILDRVDFINDLGVIMDSNMSFTDGLARWFGVDEHVQSSSILGQTNVDSSLIIKNAFLLVDFHRTNYGVHEPLDGAVRSLNEFAGLFDLHLSKNQFF
jgi:hypothetical protein